MFFTSRTVRLPKARPPEVAGPRGFPGDDGANGSDGADGTTPSDGQLTALMTPLLPARYAKVHSTDAAGDLTVTWPVGRFSAAPVVQANVVGAAGNAYVVHLVSVSSATCVVKVRAFNSLLVGLLGAALLVAPGAVSVHVRAEVASD